jgi:hypothetical protein
VNPSHGAVPLLLVLLLGPALLIARLEGRLAALVVLDFLAIHTGFAFFVGLIVPPILVRELWIHRHDGPRRVALVAAALAAAFGSLLLFFVHYQYRVDVACFQFPHPRPLEYGTFLVLMLAAFAGWLGAGVAAKVVGGLALVAMVGVVLRSLHELRGPAPQPPLVLATLAGFTLVFALNTDFGRVCQGVTTGQLGRYMPYLVPGFFAVYVTIRRMPRAVVREVLTVVFVAVLVYGETRHHRQDRDLVRWLRTGKTRWAACYRDRHDIGACDTVARFKIYPYPEATDLQWKLDYLETRGLNLFKP